MARPRWYKSPQAATSLPRRRGRPPRSLPAEQARDRSPDAIDDPQDLERCPGCGGMVRGDQPCLACSVAERGERQTPRPGSFLADHVAGLEAQLSPSDADLAEACRADRIDYLPTPEEIAVSCQAIQAGWSLTVRNSRRMFPGPIEWTAPECVMAERESPA